jgi:hypothetical protein
MNIQICRAGHNSLRLVIVQSSLVIRQGALEMWRQ